ncbi:hypothetical protein [Cypionkella sp.]|uniref:hypothetical protein n=1 Tax=Cypionkella sp. TaxID=2811411 RepID=UPI002ABC1736|nr:hypothetical protein [Cypionkella sp.]MDZ4395620.1 hypothetical protein [Cypionkella sp.]
MTKPFLTLPRVLAIDAVTCAAMGAALVAAADLAGALTEMPPPLLYWAGMALLPIAGFIAIVAWRAPAHSGAINLIILGNTLWALTSIVLLFSGAISPNPLGWLFVLGQAAAVVALTLLERGAAPRAAGV